MVSRQTRKGGRHVDLKGRGKSPKIKTIQSNLNFYSTTRGKMAVRPLEEGAEKVQEPDFPQRTQGVGGPRNEERFALSWATSRKRPGKRRGRM